MQNIKVLYIEDEISLAKIVKESLQGRSFQVQHLEDGTQLAEQFESFKPDICVFDVMLPKKDGFALGKEIRQMDPQVPILYLTAKSHTADVLQGFQSGGNDYLKKPFSLEELIVRIKNLCEMSAGKTGVMEQSSLLHLGSYTFHPTKLELSRGQEVKRLSYREAELLLVLLTQKNEIVSRKLILDKLWGDDNFFNSRNLDVYITKLRSYLKEDPNVQILTLKSVGYRLIDL